MILNLENDHVEVKNGATVERSLQLKYFQNLWSNLAKVSPTPEFLSYLILSLRDLKDEEASTLSTQITAGLFGEPLSNGVKLKVDIRDSLVKLLQELIKTRKSSDTPSSLHDKFGGGQITKHTLSVQVQIPAKLVKQQLEQQQQVPRVDVHMKAQISQMEEKLSQLFVTSLQPTLLRYNVTGNFSAKVQIEVKELDEILFNGMVSDTQALVALAIVLKCYPETWRQHFFWDAWLAITMQLGVSTGKIIFPCVWMRHIFDAERLVSPEDVQYLLFGKDPVSKASQSSPNSNPKIATGIAFHAVGNDNPSINGMKTRYGLDCDDDNPMR